MSLIYIVHVYVYTGLYTDFVFESAERLDSLFYYYTLYMYSFFPYCFIQSAKSLISLLWVKEVWYYFKPLLCFSLL